MNVCVQQINKVGAAAWLPNLLAVSRNSMASRNFSKHQTTNIACDLYWQLQPEPPTGPGSSLASTSFSPPSPSTSP